MADSAPAKAAPKSTEGAETPKVTPPSEASLPPGSARRRSDKKQRTGPFVKYVGSASERTIQPHDWVSLTIDPGSAPHTWNLKNDFILESGEFNDEQLDYLLIDDTQPSGGHSFLEVDYDDDGNLVQVVEE